MSAFDVLGFVIVICVLALLYRRWVVRLDERRGVFAKWDRMFDFLKDSVTDQEEGANSVTEKDDRKGEP